MVAMMTYNSDSIGRLDLDAVMTGQQLSLDFADVVEPVEPVMSQQGLSNNVEEGAFIEGPQGKYKPSTLPQFKGPLRGFVPERVSGNTDLLVQLIRNIPVNEFGLPAHIYRVDMLDFQYVLDLYQSCISFPPAEGRVDGTQELNTYLDSAAVLIDYSAGYPVLPNNEPFWKQLTYEPAEAYQAFLTYVQQDGIREVGRMTAYDPTVLAEYAVLYYWSARSRAFDMYRIVHHQRVKLQRTLSIEDSHFRKAENLLSKLDAYFETMELDEDTITPEKAVTMMEKLVKIQRMSVGLSASGEARETNPVRMDITPESAMQQMVNNKVRTASEDGSEELDILENDPDSIIMAQELLIRIQRSEIG